MQANKNLDRLDYEDLIDFIEERDFRGFFSKCNFII